MTNSTATRSVHSPATIVAFSGCSHHSNRLGEIALFAKIRRKQGMASHQEQPDGARRQRLRRGGSRCSHSCRLDVPSLNLGSNMTLQLAHEHNGRLLAHAHDSSPNQRTRILHALRDSNADLSKAQMFGHCHQLTANLIESLLHYLLFAKGQLPEPINQLRKKKESNLCGARSVTRRRSSGSSNRTRKEDKLLRKLDHLGRLVQDAAQHLSWLADNKGEGPSSRPYPPTQRSSTSKDLRLLVALGSSATMPRHVFVLDLIQCLGRCSITDDDIRDLVDSDVNGSVEEAETHLAQLLSEESGKKRDAARMKTSSNWERKLVRLLVSEQRLEAFFGSPLTPTKTHVFLSAPLSFRCPGWSARPHLDFDLDPLCEPDATTSDDVDLVCDSVDTSILLPKLGSATLLHKRAPPSPLQGQEAKWLKNKSARESCSSVADSWPEDSASEQFGESSMSSVSDDSRPASVADKPWRFGCSQAASVAEGWLAKCSSEHSVQSSWLNHGLHSIETSRTGSSLGSSTVYGHDSNDAAIESSREVAPSCEDGQEPDIHYQGATNEVINQVPAACVAAHDGKLGPRRRSREPKEGGLLSRNLLRAKHSRQTGYTASDSSSVRSVASSLRRVPRCAGLRIDFSDAEPSLINDSLIKEADSITQEPRTERCWFQCEAVLEGFR